VGFDGRPLPGCVDAIVAGWPCQPHVFSAQEMESYLFRQRACLRYWLGNSD
jgi:hypothetical protein